MIVFDRDGTFLRSWGEDLFERAHGLHIGPDDMLYITIGDGGGRDDHEQRQDRQDEGSSYGIGLHGILPAAGTATACVGRNGTFDPAGRPGILAQACPSRPRALC